MEMNKIEIKPDTRHCETIMERCLYLAKELEEVVFAHGGKQYRYTSEEEDILEVANQLKEVATW